MARARRLRLATRGSPLALVQARRVATLLGERGVEPELVVVQTEGDVRRDVPLAALGAQGVFVKAVQRAVLDGEADVAVHSAKDLPASTTEDGLVLAAFPERADRRDLLVGSTLTALPPGGLVATGSARRRVQLADLRPDLAFEDLRGNLARRLAAAGRHGVSAVVVAQAAVARLGWEPEAGMDVEILDPAVMVPQVGQGALAVECRADDEEAWARLAALDDPGVRREVTAERAFLAELGGGCSMPVGASAVRLEGGAVELTGMLAGDDGGAVRRHTARGDDPVRLGPSVARHLLEEAGGGSRWQPGTPRGTS